MAVSSPKVPVFCIVRGRWYQTTDLFDNRDWLVKTYADWFVAGSGSATVPLVESGPKPPTAGGGSGSGGADPRVDGLIARIVALETAGGGGADPRVDGLIARVGEVEAAAGKATEKAEKAAVTASTAASEAGNAKAAAEQAAVTAGQAKSKADEVSGELAPLLTQVGAAEAKATAAESKAVEAANTAQQAQLLVISSDQTAKAAKAVTDNLERLRVPDTYTTLQTTVRLAKQSADNAEIIANGVSRKVDQAEQKVEAISRRVEDLESTSTGQSSVELDLRASVRSGTTYDLNELPDGLLFFKPPSGGGTNANVGYTWSTSGGYSISIPTGGALAVKVDGVVAYYSENSPQNYQSFARTFMPTNGTIQIYSFIVR